MINILPPEEKAKYRRMYVLRVVATGIFFLVVVAFLAVLFLLPSYILSDMKLRVAESRLEAIQADQKGGKDMSLNAIIGDINTKLKVFSDAPQFHFSTDAIDTIILHKADTISVTSLSYAKKTDGTLGVGITGVADTREALLSFERDLKTEPKFSGLALPISDFIKDKNIEFTIEFVVAPK